LISQRGLSPNQLYLLYSMRTGIATSHINIHLELRALESGGWLKNQESSKVPILSPEAVALVDQVESFFKVSKKKTDNLVMGEGYKENIEKYLEIFPKIKLPSGKAARSDKKNVETAFKWFFETHEYSWDSVLKATEAYVSDYETRRYLYMQTSQYFIRKQQGDKTWNSELANWCAIVEGGVVEQRPHFSEKVV